MEIPAINHSWHFWKRISFRFLFIYLLLYMEPWLWLNDIPQISDMTRFYSEFKDWTVNSFNKYVLYLRPELVPFNGSGDTSYGWTLFYLSLSVALVGCLIWSLIDRKKKEYDFLDYWLLLFARYFLAMISLSYGMIKLFGQQMVFPNQSQLATPLGDFLPMRLSWLFIGYSGPYQFFSGLMETIAGLLLIYRKTSSMGAMVAFAVFTHVAVLNLCYDIPVKIFSLHLLFVSGFILVHDYRRILDFMVFNKNAAPSIQYDFDYSETWKKWLRIALKLVFIILMIGLPFINLWDGRETEIKQIKNNGLVPGHYDIESFKYLSDTIAHSRPDSLLWADLIIENEMGSLKSKDSSFRHRYNRAYFSLSVDSTTKEILFKKRSTDTIAFARFRLEQLDTIKLKLTGRNLNDSIQILLKKYERHYQLTERQFHWLSEYNR